MANNQLNDNLKVDMRKVTKEMLTVKVTITNTRIVRIGFIFLRIGCFLTGAKLIIEEPESMKEVKHGSEYL